VLRPLPTALVHHQHRAILVDDAANSNGLRQTTAWKLAADRCWTHGEGLLTSMSSQAEASGPNSGASSRRQGPVPTILALLTLLEGRNPYVSNIMPWRLTVEARRCGDANAAAIVAAGRLVRCAVAAARGAVRVLLQPRLLRAHVEPATSLGHRD